jgi:hypothetical protein
MRGDSSLCPTLYFRNTFFFFYKSRCAAESHHQLAYSLNKGTLKTCYIISQSINFNRDFNLSFSFLRIGTTTFHIGDIIYDATINFGLRFLALHQHGIEQITS